MEWFSILIHLSRQVTTNTQSLFELYHRSQFFEALPDFHPFTEFLTDRNLKYLNGSGSETFPDLNGLYNHNENDMVCIRPNNQPSGHYFQ